MAATVVTLTFQVGTGGFAVSRHVAEQLGYHYFDWDVTLEAARLAGVTPEAMAASERMPGFLERMISRLFPASLLSPEEGAAVMQAEAEVMDAAVQGMRSDSYRGFIERVVREIAARGDAVIVGHAAAAVLKSQAGVLKVLVHGSMEQRIDRLVEEQSLSRVVAERAIRQSDKDRQELFSVAYKLNWLDATNYDIAFNSDQVTETVAIDTIVAAANRTKWPRCQSFDDLLALRPKPGQRRSACIPGLDIQAPQVADNLYACCHQSPTVAGALSHWPARSLALG